MRLCLPLLFGLSAWLALSACGSAGSSADSGASAPAETGGSAAQSSGAAHGAGAGNTSSTTGGQGGKAGNAAATGNAGAFLGSGGASLAAPVTWNGAKSTSITDAQLAAEYSAWKVAHVVSCSNGSAVVVDESSVASEAIGSGLLLAAALADGALFEGLWKYYQDHLDKYGLMNSVTGKCDAPSNNGASAATDADLDTVMALVQAGAHWPSAGYLLKAQTLAGKIVQFETDTCNGRRVLRPGDGVGGCSDPDPGKQRINPSYFAPAYYKVFAHYFPAQASTWTALADGSYQLYALYQARMDNLVPDWSGPDGSDEASVYGRDACRTPWRVATDYAWTGDTRAKTFMQNVASWVDAHGGLPAAVGALPNGANEFNSAFVGSFALAGGYDQGKFDGYMSGWLNAELDDAVYYPGTLRVLYLLVAAGKFSSTL